MDVRCRVCAEPWDTESLHEEAERRATIVHLNGRQYSDLFEEVLEDFRKRGCAALGTTHADSKADPIIGMLTDILGDDIDGMATMLDGVYS